MGRAGKRRRGALVACALGAALSLMPACALTPIEQPAAEAALGHRGYTLIAAYAAALEDAAELLSDPAVAPSLRRALKEAEAAASTAVAALQAALAESIRTQMNGALHETILAAEGHITRFQALVDVAARR
ncbi:MAG: hypothetical protein GC206_10480 [Alphaproteobacteria bacterium]|nr:hypothetical protein [Alphaproteobacteria bacterium]